MSARARVYRKRARTPIIQRIRNGWQRLFLPGDLLVLIATTILLFMPALALQTSDWPIDAQITIPTLVASIIVGFLLARSRFNELIALIMSSLYGVGLILLFAGFQESGNLSEGMQSVVTRSTQWIVDATSGGINQDTLVFTLLIALLFWYLGYNALWHVFRIDRVMRVILPPGLILVTNTIIYTGNNNIDIYILIFALMACILVVHSNLDAREWDWYRSGLRVPRTVRRQFIIIGALIAALALGLALIVPSRDVQERLDDFQEFLQSDPLRELSEVWNRLFAPIDTEGPATADYYGSDQLNLGGAINLGDQIVMSVSVPNDGTRYYWRSRTFERYEQGRWVPSATLRVPDVDAPIDILMSEEFIGQARQPLQQTYTVQTNPSRLYYTAPQPLSVSSAGRIDLLYLDESETPPMNISVIRPLKVLQPGDTYNVTSLRSVAGAAELRNAGTAYPEWVINPNLSGGQLISDRVAALARQIVNDANALNPYDRAKAVENWLRTNIDYNESIPAPPRDADPIEWVLFEQQEAYCTYYATSMIMMLRHLGIPARMAAGFSQGDWDASENGYVVRERDAHTWVEVFFPEYGWIEFEPTAAEEPLNRDGDDEFESQAPEPPPIAPTETPTLTPTAIPSPTPQPTDQESDSEQPPPELPTTTITPSPTFTATPVIVPTTTPPIPPEQQNFMQSLLEAFGYVLFCIIGFVVFLVAMVLLYWWWEWRGMGGLSPIARAYARLERYINLIGIKLGRNQTPAERREEIVNRLPIIEEPVNAITKLYEDERYGGDAARNRIDDIRGGKIAREAWRDSRGNIIRRWFRRLIPFSRNR